MKRDTVTSSVSGGLHPRLLSGKCQEIENLRGEVGGWGGGGVSMAGQETSQEHEPVGHRRAMILDLSEPTSRNVLQ